MDLPERIKRIREGLNLKQLEVADRLGIDKSQYSKWEKRGKKLTVEQLESIAIALGVGLKDILFGQEEIPQDTQDFYKNKFEKSQLQKAFVVDNVLKFILNIDTLLQKKMVNYAVGEILHPRQKDYQAFVRCYCELGSEVFTLATWQKPIRKEASHFAHLEQSGEHLFDAQQPKQANQYKDAAFANIQQNHELWTINFINLTGFFRAAFEQGK
ncbi:helix-turn-helix domain-containing protein [Microscilla marina]|uniref:Bacteriophage CI repressor protein, putative n=1 Tax=Microscilla marina ATCC 23134 TaxID=313606 RepID=A1ZLU4_MICM2|nr:helix-turn-helix transcriptional regulator [Microscilla marina]EAY28848.1 bacteriophage CI repressor protein, putative [Microscilla marina ATCC 23134]